MNFATTENIKEIAELLDCGFRVFIHKTTGQLLNVPDEDELLAWDLDFSDEEQEVVENDYTDYYEVEKWTSTEAFEIMSAFANQLTDTDLQDQLLEALSKKKPFREFKFIIDDSNEFRQEWFDFKSKCQQDFVKRQLNTLQP